MWKCCKRLFSIVVLNVNFENGYDAKYAIRNGNFFVIVGSRQVNIHIKINNKFEKLSRKVNG
ncbi:hypothetical protein C9J12_27935 [Photobacterium frigidiphilum]|uniref:Uncharacterized protein n=1 Tax=Photobacterium frigidiphilum TaxID=264736 RepID=A0A2T3J6H2_9GAMM|nr:hypothetical protein C9J12_27935 [Photobacterium frigidiphilum]